MSPDELQMQFELVRQSIATWSAETARLVAAASQARQTGIRESEEAEAASRMLWTVREEMSALADASRSTPAKSADLVRGIETALAELGSLDRDIAQALDDLAGSPA